MKTKYITIIPWFAFCFAISAQADVELKDQSEILGKWKLYAEAGKLDGEKKNVDIEWNFTADGIIHTKGADSLGRTEEMNIPVAYKVEDGVIKKETAPGRGKFESCKVIEKSDSDMILKCPFQYFFLTKK